MPLTDSLLAHWKLNEASGQRNDSHGSNHLTDNNTVTQAAGKIGDAASFASASSEYLSTADNADLSFGNEDFTIAAWVYVASKAAARGIVGKADSAVATSIEYALDYDNASDRFLFRVGNLAEGVSVHANVLGAPSVNTWYFIVAWHDAAADRIRISVNNGAADETELTTGCADGTRAFEIGRVFNTFAPEYMDGRIDSVSVWGRVLTAQERTDLYAAGAGLDYPFSVAAAAKAHCRLGTGCGLGV